MDDKDNVDRIPVVGDCRDFSSDATWTIFPGDYTFVGSDIMRESSVLNDFGWNFHPPPPVFDRIDSDTVGTSAPSPEVGVGAAASGSVDEAGDVSLSSNPLVSSSSSEDRAESSTASGDTVSGGKPPSSDRA